MKAGAELKTAFICPERQFAYKRMGMGLKNGTHTYSRFRDMVFGHIPALKDDKGKVIVSVMESLVGDHGDWACDGIIDDSFSAQVNWGTEYEIWYNIIFPRIAFGPIYLKGSKCAFSMTTLDITKD